MQLNKDKSDIQVPRNSYSMDRVIEPDRISPSGLLTFSAQKPKKLKYKHILRFSAQSSLI